MAPFKVLVNDNAHYMDETERMRELPWSRSDFAFSQNRNGQPDNIEKASERPK
jgi:hypothetical protein